MQHENVVFGEDRRISPASLNHEFVCLHISPGLSIFFAFFTFCHSVILVSLVYQSWVHTRINLLKFRRRRIRPDRGLGSQSSRWLLAR